MSHRTPRRRIEKKSLADCLALLRQLSIIADAAAAAADYWDGNAAVVVDADREMARQQQTHGQIARLGLWPLLLRVLLLRGRP